MRVWQIRVIGSAFILALLLALIFLFPRITLPEGSVPLGKIVSSCIGDATNDGAPELLAISGDGVIDTGERHGAFLLVCDASAEDDLAGAGYIPPEKIRYSIDLSAIKPIKVQLGDVNGDGAAEVALCVYKTTKFHPDMAKRPFFFDLVGGNLIPVWLGSRLSRPFDDYIDDADEIVSVERLEDGRRVLAAYAWKGFGFEMLAESEAFDGELRFEPDTAGAASEDKEINVLSTNIWEQTRLAFRLNEDTFIYKTLMN